MTKVPVAQRTFCVDHETFGRDESITPLEFLPYYRWPDQLLFNHVRLFVGNTGNFGGNFGLGYRFATDWADALGASFWYDTDDTTGFLFQQTGVSLEELVPHVIVPEVGHHFGFSDADMHAIEDAAD